MNQHHDRLGGIEVQGAIGIVGAGTEPGDVQRQIRRRLVEVTLVAAPGRR